MQMNANDWDRAKELFEAALELESSQRASFLTANCHDVSLQQQVEKLLIDYQAAGSFLDNPALNSAEIPIDQVSRILPSSEEHHGRATSEETEDPLINRRLGDYKLVRRVGRGGMAAVFLAVRADEEYQKEVAVKLVQPGLDSQDVLSRFRNERQTLAGLDHPNIVKLLDGGSTPEGLPFLVMEYVEGSPIDEYCDRHKLSVDKRLRLFSDVCDAVQYAHEKLVIHRDVKPSNILVVADGTPKLLDFGIAKVLNPEPRAQSSLATQTSLRCMTPAYASPEQMRGKSVTPETDVYSLGVVLYELLTGHRPYRLTQHSPAEIERAICEQEPETPSTAISRVENDTTPDGKPITKTPELVSLTREGEPDKLRRRLRGDLDNIVLKALQKEPQLRYGSVAEFSQDIDRHLEHQPVKARPSTFAYRVSKFFQRHRIEVSAACAVIVVIAAAASIAFNAAGLRDRVGIGSSQRRIQSLAVMPLANSSGDSAQEYFSDGMTDALITDLAEIGSLKVISRTSSMQYKQTKKTLPEIAHELNVDGIIEGTVQRSGDRVRVTANLIQAATDKHVWARSYERDVQDVFTLEREVAEDIARQVHAELTTEKQAQLSRPQPANPKALDAYLRGNYYLTRAQWSVAEDDKRMAAQYFQQAIDADSDFAPAYIGLANAHDWLARGSSEDTAIKKRAADKALELDPNSSEAWEILGFIKWYAFDWGGAEQDFRRAVALNPNRATSIDELGLLHAAMGRLDEALREGEIAQELDPNEDHLSMVLEARREHKRAIELLQRMVVLHPTDSGPHILLWRNYAEIGMLTEATQELEKGLTLMGAPEIATDVHGGFAVSGYRGAMREYAKALEAAQEAKKAFAPGTLAEVYTALGDKDRAFYWLEQAYVHRENYSLDGGLTGIKADRLLDPVRNDPRFADLLRRIGLPP
jgi:serine/threonine protein kinase/tetratricopeptide (TPR) repeat protein